MSAVMVPPLTASELRFIHKLREDDLLTFEQMASLLDVHTSTIHRVYAKPGYRPADRILGRMRKAMAKARRHTTARDRREGPSELMAG